MFACIFRGIKYAFQGNKAVSGPLMMHIFNLNSNLITKSTRVVLADNAGNVQVQLSYLVTKLKVQNDQKS